MGASGVQIESWYNHPEWFEIGFDDVTSKEADFFEAAYKKWCPFKVKKLFEPACGSGRLVTEMASRGYDMTGFDLSEPSLNFLRRRLKQQGLKARLFPGDMSNFTLPGKYDGGFCTYNSFRHLTTEETARGHLECVAKALRPGALYFLGLHLAPPDIEPLGTERWTGCRGRTHVTTTLRVTASDPKRRVETLRISVLVRELAKSSKNGVANGHAQDGVNGSAKKSKTNSVAAKNGKAYSNGVHRPRRKPMVAGSKIIGRLRDEFDYRLYNAAQIRKFLASVKSLELVEVFDFWYDMDDPQKLDNDLIDALFVLRRR